MRAGAGMAISITIRSSRVPGAIQTAIAIIVIRELLRGRRIRSITAIPISSMFFHRKLIVRRVMQIITPVISAMRPPGESEKTISVNIRSMSILIPPVKRVM